MATLATWPLLEDVVRWKALGGSVDDDWVDRMSHKWTVTVLVVFSAVVSSAQYVGDPIHCWVPAHQKKSWHLNYVKRYCWISNTYHVPMSDVIPGDADVRRETELSYYQWVPIILLMQALMFKLPNVFWHMTNRSAGINLTKLCRLVDESLTESAKNRAKSIRDITAYLDRWLRERRQYHSNAMVRLKRKTANVFFFCFGQREGFFLSGLYLLIKLIYMGNCCLQFWLLGEFLSISFMQYGVDCFRCIMGDCSQFAESPRFPRVTLCDYKIRQLQNVQPHTVQCVLPINLFNEKIFVFLWFWILITGVLTFINIVSWLLYMISRNSRTTFVRSYLTAAIECREDETLLKEFADKYLRTDGCFLLKMVKKNTSDVTLTELMTELWTKYVEEKRTRRVRFADDP